MNPCILFPENTKSQNIGRFMTSKINFLFFTVVAVCLIQEKNISCENNIFKAIKNGNLKQFKQCLRENPNAINQTGGTFQIVPLAALPYQRNYSFTVKALAFIAAQYPSFKTFQQAAHDAYWNATTNDNMIFIRLLAQHATITKDLINQQNNHGNTLQHIIADNSNNHPGISSERKAHRKALRILQNMGADTSRKNLFGQTPADMAEYPDVQETLSVK